MLNQPHNTLADPVLTLDPEAQVPAIRDEPQSMLDRFDRYLRDPSVDVEKLERLIAVYERVQAQEARARYNEAMTLAQNDIQPVARTTENKITGNFYAKLEAVDAAIRPIYLKYGFALSYDTVEPLVAGNIRVRCLCSLGRHVETYHREGAPDTHGPKGNPTKTPLHGQASTETFLKRYLACGIFNVVFKDMDNDGNGALSGDQIDYIVDLIKRSRAGPKFLEYMKAKSVDDAGSLEAAVATIAPKDYRKAIVTLEERLAKLETADAHP